MSNGRTIAGKDFFSNPSPSPVEVQVATDGSVIVDRSRTMGVTITGPAGVAAYAAGDVVSNGSVITLANCARGATSPIGLSGYIVRAVLITDNPACVSHFRLHLYNVAPSGIADNAPLTFLYADRGNYVGMIDFAPMISEGVGSTAAYAANSTVRQAYNCAAAGTSLFALLETVDGFTPTASENYFLSITVAQN